MMKKSVSLFSLCLFLAALGASPRTALGTEVPPEVTPAPSPVRAGNPGAAPVRGSGGIQDRGLFFEVGLGGQMSVYSTAGAGAQPIGGSFLVGYKLSRLIFGLGLEYSHRSNYESRRMVVGGVTVESKGHSVIDAMLFQPTIQYHLLESSPLALFLTAGVHIGFAVWDETGTEDDDDTTTTLFGFHLGLGFRYFLHPRFTIGVEGGFRGLWVHSRYDPGSSALAKNTDAVGGFYGRIGFAAIW